MDVLDSSTWYVVFDGRQEPLMATLKRPGPTLADLSKANMMIDVRNSKRLQPSAKAAASACNVPLGYLKVLLCAMQSMHMQKVHWR